MTINVHQCHGVLQLSGSSVLSLPLSLALLLLLLLPVAVVIRPRQPISVRPSVRSTADYCKGFAVTARLQGSTLGRARSATTNFRAQ